MQTFEDDTRDATDFTSLAAGVRRFGAGPHALAQLGPGRLVGTLRGADAIVVLDEAGSELQRLPAPASPVDVVVIADTVYVIGEEASEIGIYGRAKDGTLRARPSAPLPGRGSWRALATDGKRLFIADDHESGLLVAGRKPDGSLTAATRFGTCHGPVDLAVGADHLVAACLGQRALAIFDINAAPKPRGTVVHDGPFWSVAPPVAARGAVFIAAGGVENRALDRSEGFGYVDSFAFVVRLHKEDPPSTVAAVNIASVGVVTPKWIDLRVDDRSATIEVTGYGADKRASLRFSDPTWSTPPTIDAQPTVPGITAVVGAVAANPLLDAWVVHTEGAPSVVPVPPPSGAQANLDARIGEALVFTTLMAPWNESEGMRSRFTCETCHFEGYGDGRVHFTGRGTIHAVTKPLLGLFNNRPHFSRALDPTMTVMVNNEFRAANKGNGHDPWFALQTEDYPWVRHLGDVPDELGPEALRRALMSFLMEFSHRPNPATRGLQAWTDAQRQGAEVFRDRCESCHQARLVADDSDTRMPFERWESLTLAPAGAITWAMHEYRKTGVEPYVHDRGTRVPSLRRLYKKRPYFTNGKAASIADVLTAGGEAESGYLHQGASSDAKRLSPAERDAVAEFLGLL